MDIFDGEFTTEDAAILGGAIGFAEESIQIEEKDAEEPPGVETSDTESDAMEETDLRLIRNANPSLFRYVLEVARKQSKRWARDRKDREVVAEELEAMAKCERENNDS